MQDMDLLPFIIGIAIVGIICGSFTAYLADEKGRSAGAWFVLGFCFNLLALLTLIGAPDVRSSQGTPTQASVPQQPPTAYRASTGTVSGPVADFLQGDDRQERSGKPRQPIEGYTAGRRHVARLNDGNLRCDPGLERGYGNVVCLGCQRARALIWRVVHLRVAAGYYCFHSVGPAPITPEATIPFDRHIIDTRRASADS